MGRPSRYPEDFRREAVELYREALRIAPEAAGLYLEAAEVELLGDEAEAAAGHAARAAELEPDNALAHRLQGDALREMGQFEEAISILIEGKSEAVLIDTGCGIGNIKNAVEEITNVPVMVLNTHTHNDHVAQIG